jgi:hypothetical protein
MEKTHVFIAHVKAIVPECTNHHCILHHYSLAVKDSKCSENSVGWSCEGFTLYKIKTTELKNFQCTLWWNGQQLHNTIIAAHWSLMAITRQSFVLSIRIVFRRYLNSAPRLQLALAIQEHLFATAFYNWRIQMLSCCNSWFCHIHDSSGSCSQYFESLICKKKILNKLFPW